MEKRVVPVRSQLIWRPPSTGRWYLSAPLVCLVSYCYCPDFPDWIAWARTTGHLPHSFSLILLLKKFLLKGWFLNVHNVSQSLWAERDRSSPSVGCPSPFVCLLIFQVGHLLGRHVFQPLHTSQLTMASLVPSLYPTQTSITELFNLTAFSCLYLPACKWLEGKGPMWPDKHLWTDEINRERGNLNGECTRESEPTRLS